MKMIPALLLFSALCTPVAATTGENANHRELTMSEAEARTALQQGDITTALEQFQQLATEQPGSASIHEGLGSAWLLNQHYRDAANAFQRAISEDASRGDAFIGLAVSYIHMGMFPHAKAALQEARQRKPESASDIDNLLSWLEQKEKQNTNRAIH